jgi:hypothetical protein
MDYLHEIRSFFLVSIAIQTKYLILCGINFAVISAFYATAMLVLDVITREKYKGHIRNLIH